MKKKLAVLISDAGTGTNLQAIIDGMESGKINAEIVLVVSDKENAQGLERAKTHNIPTHILAEDENLTKLLKEKEVDFVCLGGWKKIIPDEFIKAFENKILNVHPGLIPDTINGVVKNPDRTDSLWNKGKFTEKAIQNFLDQHSTYAGSTIHFLSDEFDFGPVLARGFVKIEPNDTVESLYERLKKKENEIYVQALERLCNG